MRDTFQREITYLRISVTDRCNLRCVYCMPAGGIPLISHQEVLRFEEILEVARAATELGIQKIRVTGGEPLVRKGIVSLVAMLAQLEGLDELVMTTNGILLAPLAADLKKAGLRRINISLDSIDPARYSEITRGGDLDSVLAGIHAAREAGLNPVKLNCVVSHSSTEQDATGVREFAAREKIEVRFIRRMDMQKGEFWKVEGGEGGNCASCNRLRLSSDGKIYPCLFSDKFFSVRELGPAGAIRAAILGKPESGRCCLKNRFHTLGG